MNDHATPKKQRKSSSLVDVDSPDDFAYEGNQSSSITANIASESQGDDAYVKVDNPDDFE